MAAPAPEASDTRPDDDRPEPPPGRHARRSLAASILPVLIQGGLTVLVLAGGVGMARWLISLQPRPRTAVPVSNPPAVVAVPLVPVPIRRAWTGYGTARAMNAADVAAEVEGIVVERPRELEAGAEVAPGALIVRLDDRDFRQLEVARRQQVATLEADLHAIREGGPDEVGLSAQVDATEAELAAASRDLERARQSLTMGAGNEGEVDRRQRAVESLRRQAAEIRRRLELLPSQRTALTARRDAAVADLARATRDVRRCVIESPIGGTLQDVYAEPGEYVRRGEIIARIVDLTRIEIPVLLPLSAAPSLRPGDEAVLRRDGATAPIASGIVARIAPEADESTRTIPVFVTVEQDPDVAADLIRPGQVLFAEVTQARASEGWVVPRRAVRDDRVSLALPGEDGIWSVELREVRIEHSFEGSVPRIDPDERQWSAVAWADGDPPAGARLIVTDLSALGRPSSVRVAERASGGPAAPVVGVRP